MTKAALAAWAFAIASSAVWSYIFLRQLLGDDVLLYEHVKPIAAVELLLAFSSGVWFLANFRKFTSGK